MYLDLASLEEFGILTWLGHYQSDNDGYGFGELMRGCQSDGRTIYINIYFSSTPSSRTVSAVDFDVLSQSELSDFENFN